MSTGVGVGAEVNAEGLSDGVLNSEITRLAALVADGKPPREQIKNTLVKLRREKLRRAFYAALATFEASDPMLATATGVSIETD